MLQDILEVVTFIKDNAAMKDDLKAVEVRLDQRIDKLETRFDGLEGSFDGLGLHVLGIETRLDKRIDEVIAQATRNKSDIFKHIDGLAVQFQKFEIELLALRSKYDRLKEPIIKMAKQLHIEASL